MKLLTRFTQTPRDLKPDSDLVKKLRLNPVPPNTYSASIASNGDTICPPMLCAFDKPEGAEHHINETVDVTNHFNLMADERVYHAVRKHLEEGFRREDTKQPDADRTVTLSDL